MKKYSINEIFHSLQGEGYNMGRAAVFIRFSGCNLKCPFCDTDFSNYTLLSAEEIISAALQLAGNLPDMPMVVLTGGEPTLQADTGLVDSLHAAGFRFVAMESNGTMPPPANIDWLTVSPKGRTNVTRCDELKCLFGEEGIMAMPETIDATHRYIQPCDTGDEETNARITRRCIDFIKQHPSWRLSLQTHKIIGIR